MGKASTRARREAARGAGPQGRGAGGRKGQRARDEPRRNLLGIGLVALVAVVVLAGGIVVGLSLGDPDDDADPVASGVIGGELRSLAVSPVEPRRLFAGGDGAASTSGTGGKRWTEIEALQDVGATSWVVAPDAVYVSGRSGLHRSNDGVTTFQQVNEGLPSTDVRALGGGAAVLYGASPDAGVFAGQPGRWEVRSADAGRSFVGRIAVVPGDDDHLFAADSSAGVAESTDGGRTWRTLDTGLSAAAWVSQGGNGPDVIVASGPESAVISRDAGQSWEPLDLPEGASLVEVYPDEPDLLYTGIRVGRRVEIRISIDGGQTWTRPDANNAGAPAP